MPKKRAAVHPEKNVADNHTKGSSILKLEEPFYLISIAIHEIFSLILIS